MYDLDNLLSFGPYQVAVTAYDMFLQLWYFLVIGILIGVAFHVFVPTGKIKWLRQNSPSYRAIIVASLLGALSPLGSYAVIPTIVVLLRIGVPLAIVMAFLTSSPLISPYDFTITLQVLGPKMAFARVFSAIIVGICTGLIFRLLARFRSFQNGGGAIRVPSFMKEIDSCGQPALMNGQGKPPEVGAHRPLRNRWRDFFIECLKMTRYAGRWFALSIILAALVNVYVPTDWIVRSLGGHTYSLLLAAGMAIPLYVCGGGAVPFIWQLMRSGMDQGAALAFFVAGPVTKIAPMLTVISLVGYPSFICYLLISMGAALVLGFFYHFV